MFPSPPSSESPRDSQPGPRPLRANQRPPRERAAGDDPRHGEPALAVQREVDAGDQTAEPEEEPVHARGAVRPRHPHHHHPGHPGVSAAQREPSLPGSVPGLPEAQQLCGPDQSPGVPEDAQHAVSQPHTRQRQRLQGRVGLDPDAVGCRRKEGEEGPSTESHAPLLYYELQTAIKSLLKHINLPLHQARHFRLYSQEVVELGHGVSFLLLLPAADNVCSAPGQSNPYTPLSGFLHLPLQMFELVHFCTYKEKFISLYCRLSSVLDLDALITQQALREAITDSEVTTAKQRHQLILDYIQQLDEMRRDLRWITDALQYARYKQPRGGVPITCLVDANAPESDPSQQKNDSTSSNMDYLPTPSPSPELRRRKAISDSLLGSDEDGSSEVFLPTDSDYDSSDALSPRELDLLYSPPQGLSQQALHSLGGSAPDVLQIHELRYSVCPPTDLPLSPALKDPKSSPLLTPHSPSLSKHFPFSTSALPRSPSLSRTLPTSPSLPLSPRFSNDLPLSLPLSPALSDTTKTLEGLSLSKEGIAPLRALANPPAKRKLLSRSHRGQYFSGPQRWLKGHSGESLTGSLSEGVYTKQVDQDLTPLGDSPSLQGPTYVSHASCVLESRKGRQREPRPHIRRIFVEPCKELSPGHERRDWGEGELGGGTTKEVTAAGVSVVVAQVESEGEGEEPEGAATQEVDSDDQTNAQVSEILSSTL
uniref:Uncharacterized LOC110005134 n=1 Tax=Labrus bergylta TaxID=56723 RepID=A0A3Q3FTU5_9LABR